MKHFVNIETENGKKKLVYDTELIDYCITNSEQDSLLHNIMTNFKANIPESGIATELNGSIAPEYSLKMSQLMAGYQLTISADSKLFGSELKNEQVAYAATEKTAENYFYDGDKLNWDNVEEWFAGESVPAESIEYDVLAYAMQGLKDSEIEKLLECSEINADLYGCGYNQSDKLDILAYKYLLQAGLEETIDERNTDNYTRAVLVKNIVDSFYCSRGGKKHIVSISSKQEGSRKIYKASVTVWNNSTDTADALLNYSNSKSIVVYPWGNSRTIDVNLDNESAETVKAIVPTLKEENTVKIIDTTVSLILKKWKRTCL